MPQAFGGTMVTDENQIAAGVIKNTHINAAAGIVDTKLATIATAGKVSGAALTLLPNTPGAAGALPVANETVVGDLTVHALPGSGILAGATLQNAGQVTVVTFANGSNQSWLTQVKAPRGAVSLAGINIYFYGSSGAAGNVYLQINTWHWNTDAESAAEADTSMALTAIALTGVNSKITKYQVPAACFDALSNIDQDDIIAISVRRDASNVADTYELEWDIASIEFVFA